MKQSQIRNAFVFTLTPSSTPPSAAALSTIGAERTALAQFTRNPTLALSSTPFYAQIIYNEVIRNLTEVPFPKRPCYLDPADVPLNLATPITKCGAFVGTMMLGDEPRKIMAVMEKAGIQGTVGIESYGVEGINDSFLAVQSRVGVMINLNDFTDQKLINDTVTTLVDILVQNWKPSERVSNNATISIEISNGSQNKSMLTTFATLFNAHKNDLKGENLVQALGGFTESN